MGRFGQHVHQYLHAGQTLSLVELRCAPWRFGAVSLSFDSIPLVTHHCQKHKRTGALVTLREHCVLRRGQGLAAPFPAPLIPLAASFLRYASDRFLLTKPNTSCRIEVPASLRSDGVRDYSGMPFGIITDLVFGFVGIAVLVWLWRRFRGQ